MKYPARVQVIANALFDLNTALVQGNDDERRAYAQKLAEQVCFELGPQWGMKRADKNRPLSKDTLAFNGLDQLHGWDMVNGTSRTINQFPEEVPPHEMVEQVFVPVSPVNHLGAPQSPQAPEPQPQPEPAPQPAPQPASCQCQFTPCDSEPLRRELAQTKAAVNILIAQVEQLQDIVKAVAQRTYPTRAEGRLFGARIALDLT